MRINPERLRADLERLSEFGREPDGTVSRPALSGADISAREWYARIAHDAGLTVTVDGLFNVVARAGDDAGPTVWTGSHLDSVPRGGMFDGAVGAMAALECVRRLREESVPLTRPVAAVAFSDEEGAFHGYLGSKGLVRDWRENELAGIRNREGVSLLRALRERNVGTARATTTALPADAVHAFLELHIEQGPVLDDTGTVIGVVTEIVGVNRGEFRFEGRADHAGTTPMHLRRDALRGAAAFLNDLPALPAQCGHPTAVATCGRLTLSPGADNVVPARAIVHVDFRDATSERLDSLEDAMVRKAQACAAAHALSMHYRRVNTTPPAALDPRLVEIIEGAAQRLTLSTRRMPSGAGHDAQVMAALGPVGMIFVPSIRGRSHSGSESTTWEHIVHGANVLLQTVLHVATCTAEEVSKCQARML